MQTSIVIAPPLTACGTKYALNKHLLGLLLTARPCLGKTGRSVLGCAPEPSWSHGKCCH